MAYFAIELDEKHVGDIWLASIDRRNRKAEIRIFVGSGEARGKGVGRTAIKQLAQLAFNSLDLHRLYAHVLKVNEPAQSAFKKAGFLVEGVLKDDRWILPDACFFDCVVLGLTRPE